MRFTVHNNRPEETTLSTLELHDEIGADYAGTTQIGSKGSPDGKVLAVIKPWASMVGTVAVRNFKQLRSTVKLVVNGVGVKPAFRIVPIDPPEEPPLTPREKRARQVTVGVQGVFGAFTIADGLGAGQLEATSFAGFGIRITKGFHENIAVEVEAAGGKTGNAQFENMSIDNMQGDLTRSASFGRMGFGGLLRFGDKVTPYLRLGAGLQAASFDAAFSAGPEPDAPFEFSPFLALGGGVNLRIGEGLLVGLALAGSAPINSDEDLTRNTFEIGMNVSYGWNP